MVSQTYIWGRPATLGAVLFIGVLLGILFSLCYGIFAYAYHQFLRMQQKENFIQQYQEVQAHYYDQLLATGNTMRMLRHDLNNHLQTFQYLLSEQPAKAAEYLNQIQAMLLRGDSGESQALLSFVLDVGRKKAEKAGCSFDSEITNASKAQETVLFALLPIVLSIALRSARSGTQILLQRLADGAEGFRLSYVSRTCGFGVRSHIRSFNTSAKEYGCSLRYTREQKQTCLILSADAASLPLEIPFNIY